MCSPDCGVTCTRSASCPCGYARWKTRGDLLKMTVHWSACGIAQRLYVPAGSALSFTPTGGLKAMMAAGAAVDDVDPGVADHLHHGAELTPADRRLLGAGARAPRDE